MRQRDFISRMYAAGAPHGTGYNTIRRYLTGNHKPQHLFEASEGIITGLLMMIETNYKHSFKQDDYKAEYWGSRYTNYALDFYGLRGF